jgi:hypothetical protein
MKFRLFLLGLFAPLALHAQLILVSVAPGSVETATGPVYGFGQVAAGDSKDVRFRARNTGTTAVTVTTLRVTGTGFSIVNTSSTPYTVAPGNVMDLIVRFSATAGTSPGTSYNATLQVNTLSTILLATVVAAPSLSVAAPCTGPDSSLAISFGRIQQGGQLACTLSLNNPYANPLTVSPINLAGAAFTTTSASAVTVPAGQSTNFTLTFTASAATSYFGSLTVGTRTYTLVGTGYSSPLPTPVLTFDSTAISSGQQHTLTITLPTPSPVTASGTLTLVFKPAVSSIADDTAVQFVATSKRVATFTVNAGDTAVKINGQPNIVFSTGTTAGSITFQVDAGIYGTVSDPTTSLNIGPTPVAIASASATRRANDLDVTVSGFDNTYTMGAMSFTFFDRSGGVIAAGISADFSSNFHTFFQGQTSSGPTSGSSFLMRVTFPVTGDATQIGAMEATLNNAAGAVKTQRLNFP